MDVRDDLWAGLVCEADAHHPVLVDSLMAECGLEAEALAHEADGYVTDDTSVPTAQSDDAMGDGSMIPDASARTPGGIGVQDDADAGSSSGAAQPPVVPSASTGDGSDTGAPLDPSRTTAKIAGVAPGLEWLAGPSGGAGDVSGDIERMHREAAKMFSPAERAQLINEGEGLRAGNLDRMDVSGTHYVDDEVLW